MVQVGQLARGVDWRLHYYPALVHALVEHPNKLPLRVCAHDGQLELIDGKHRLGAAIKRDQFLILAYVHNHDREI